MKISKKTRNEIVEAIQASTFEPAEFAREEDGDGLSVRHVPSGSEMTVGYGVVGHPLVVTWKIGEEPMKRHYVDGLDRTTHMWLKDLRDDLETPDLWSEFGQGPRMSALLEDQENTPFSPQERREVADVLTEVKRQAQERYGLPLEQLLAIERKLDYLCEATSRMGRVDWINLAIGTVVGRFADALLTPDVVNSVLHALSTGLGPLFGHPVPLVGP